MGIVHAYMNDHIEDVCCHESNDADMMSMVAMRQRVVNTPDHFLGPGE